MIVAVTGHSEPAYVQKALDSGMNEVLIKPIQVNMLKEVPVNYLLMTSTVMGQKLVMI